MNSSKNPVVEQKIARDTAEKLKTNQDKWMMDHGVKFYKHPFEYDNYYGLGRSTETPSPSLTRDFSDRFGCDPNCAFSWVLRPRTLPTHADICRETQCSSYRAEQLCRMRTRDEYGKGARADRGGEKYESCKASPESRYLICSDCFYKAFYTVPERN